MWQSHTFVLRPDLRPGQTGRHPGVRAKRPEQTDEPVPCGPQAASI
jgi:hypothetical protein